MKSGQAHGGKTALLFLGTVACALLLPIALPASAAAQAPRAKDLIAVLDLEGVNTEPQEASALTDRLREELLRSGKFTLVDRSQMEAILEEQAFQQTGCTEQECAVQVGQILGVRKIVAGRVTKISEQIWLVSALMVDVETAETLRAESVRHRGDFFTLLDVTIVDLAAKLSQEPEAPAVAARPPPKEEAPPAKVEERPLSPEQRAYQEALSTWRWRFWPAVAGALVAGALTLQADGEVEDSNDAQTAARAEAESAATLAQFNAAMARIDAEKSNGEDMASRSQLYSLVALGLAGLAVWYYLDAPEPPAVSVSFAPPSALPARNGRSDPGVRLILVKRW